MAIRWIFSVLLIFLAGCVSVDKYAQRQLAFKNYSQTEYAPKPENASVDLFFNGKPQEKYEVIGEISGTVEKELRPILEARARQLGADAVIDIDTSVKRVDTPKNIKITPGIYQGQENVVVEPGSSTKIFNVRAKLIRYRKD